MAAATGGPARQLLADAKREPRRPRLRRPLAVCMSPPMFALSWMLVLGFHALCFVYCALAARVYEFLPSSFLIYIISSQNLAIDARYFPLVAAAHALVAVGHAAFILLMLVASLAHGRLEFFWWPAPSHTSTTARRPSSVVPTGGVSTQSGHPSARGSQSLQAWSHKQIAGVQRGFLALFSRRGFFGIDSDYFDHILIARELCEALMQSVQAYYLAQLLPRPSLVRVYVALLVVNCWSTLLLHHVFHLDPARQRMLALVSDVTLDFASAIGVWVVVALPYVHQYDPVVKSLPNSSFYDEVWYITFLNDFHLVLVSSWVDFACQLAFFISIFGSINDIKLLLRPSSAPRRRSTAPMTKQIPTPEQPRHPSLDRWTRIAQGLLVLLGLAILVIHIASEVKPDVPGCHVKVLSWFSRKPACALLELDCYRRGMDGSAADITAALDPVDLASIELLTLVHCSELVVPPRLQDLRGLFGLKIFNSTIREWGDDAALTAASHTRLGVFLAVLVNTTDHQLPRGLYSPQFPPSLTCLQFSAVDFVSLPDEINMIWPPGLTLLWEQSNMPVVPPVLISMSIVSFSLAGNAIAVLPKELLFMPSLLVLDVGSNPLTALPEIEAHDANPWPALITLRITDTNLSVLPSWMDDTFLSHHGILASETPLCASIAAGAVISGMDTDVIKNTVNCVFTAAPGELPLAAMMEQYHIDTG